MTPPSPTHDYDTPTVTIHLGDTTWHDGVGWYYVIDEYPEEGSCGAFETRALCEARAVVDGYAISGETRPGFVEEERTP